MFTRSLVAACLRGFEQRCGGEQFEPPLFSRALDCGVKVQLLCQLGQFLVKADQGPTTLAAGEVECIGKVHPLAMPSQRSPNQLFLLQVKVTNG